MEKAGTALRGALTRLLKPSKQNLDGFEQLGVSVEDFKKGAITLPDILDSIKKNTANWTDAQRTSAIALAFGTESQSAMNVMVGQGGDALRTLTAETESATGATKEISDSMKDLPANKVAQFKESIKVLGITFGEKLLPLVIPWIEKATEMIDSFSKLDDATQKNIIKWGLMAAAAGPALKLLGGGVSIIGTTTKTIGSLSKGLVDLAAKSAAKSAVAGLTTEIAAAGTAAASASGTAGIGAMTGAVGGLAAALPAIVGVGGLLAVGYGAWKTFGEEAWNSSQRVKQWGTDVGSEVDKTLDNVKIKTESATGQFGLLSSGVSTNTGEMVTNFSAIGTSIEDSLNKKVLGLDGLLKALPETVSETMRQIIEDEKALTETSLESVAENNTRIKEMREKASNENRELTVSEVKQIQDLSTKSAEAYVETLDVSAEQKKVILKSMTADVSSATKEEASLMMQSLGEQYNAQQSHYAQSRTEQEKWLKDWGYNLDGEFAQKYLDEWDKMNEATGDGFLNQMALIKEKYPELQNEVHMGSGQLIEEAVGAGQMLIEDNERLMSSVANMGDRLAENARKNADQISLTAEAGTAAGDMWNSLELLDKNGEIKTNAQETVNEAANSEASWNQMQWLVKDADVSSNIKMMIAEAAIANGQWENMSFTDQQAMLDSNVTQKMTQALQASGDWSELTFDEKKALIYSNTPEKMAETMLSLGVWDEYQPEIKDLNAKNEGFLTILDNSEEKLANWNSITPETKELLGENYDVLQKIYESEEQYNAWINLPEEEKKFLANNTDVLMKVLNSEESLGQWNALPVNEKQILGNNADLLGKVFSSTESFNGWNSLPTEIKNMLGNNQDILQKVYDGTITVEDYNANVVPALKQLYGDNSPLAGTISDATNAINYYNREIVPDSKTLNASTNANDVYGPLDILKGTWNSLPDAGYKTMTIETKTFGPQLPGRATGTNFHGGGPMMVNDQKGSLYRELIVRPTGESFIPFGRNVILPNEPVGTKVFTASKTKRLIPHYADGIGIPENSSLIKNLRETAGESNQTINIDNSGMTDLLKQMLNAINRLKPEINIYPKNWSDSGDIRRTSEELAQLTKIQERGLLS